MIPKKHRIALLLPLLLLLTSPAIDAVSSDPNVRGRVASTLAGAAILLTGGDVDDVQVAAQIGNTTRMYNREKHPDEKEFDRHIAQKLAEAGFGTTRSEQDIVGRMTDVLVQKKKGLKAAHPDGPTYQKQINQLWKLYPKRMAVVIQEIRGQEGVGQVLPYTYTKSDWIGDIDVPIEPVYLVENVMDLIPGVGVAARTTRVGGKNILKGARQATEVIGQALSRKTSQPTSKVLVNPEGPRFDRKAITRGSIQHTKHSLNQKINRQVKSADELKAIKNPLKKTEVKHDSQGRPSEKYIGEKATVAVNPDTGKIVTVHPTSTKSVNRLQKQQGGGQ